MMKINGGFMEELKALTRTGGATVSGCRDLLVHCRLG
jgi:hypothetical protein